MELVDANTKNYVFLTLSQYNAEQDLVRTRVSMRRDQPFWDGGNSYIACESFRITSSPSQGGLYYKVFPYEWYMGCKLPQNRDTAPANDNDSWESSMVPAPPAQPTIALTALVTGGGDDFSAPPVLSNVGGLETIETNLYVWGVKANSIVPYALESQDPTVCRMALESYINQFFLANRGWVRLKQATGAVPSNDPDVDGAGYAIGRLKGNPANAITGNGLGIDKLYYPEIDVAHPTGSMATLVNLAALTKQTMVNNPFTIMFKTLAQPNSGEVAMPQVEYDTLRTSIGKGLHIQVRTSAAHPRAWQPMVYGSIWTVLGIADVHYTFQQQFFQGSGVAPDDETVGDCSTAPLRPIRFNQLVEGATCWIDIDDNDATFAPGRYEGTITQVPSQTQMTFGFPFDNTPVRASYPTLGLYVQATETLYDLIKTGAATGAEAREALLNQKLIVTTDAKPLASSIHTKIEFDVSTKANLKVFAQGDIVEVQYAANRNAEQKMCIRRPQRYIYTPNEMFYAFNHKEQFGGAYADLPYKIQTDENGGFCIYWRPTTSNADSFVISVALSEALGLNSFFEYDWDEYLDDSDHNLMYVMKVEQGTHQDEDISLWFDHNDMRMSADLATRVPVPVPEGNDGMPLVVYDRDGNKYTYVRSYQYTEKRFQTIKRQIYPTVHTDEDGTDYYRYNNLPGDGEIRNTQMVSVESFSTYSEITLVIPNLPFQSMLGTSSDERILASLRLPFQNGTNNDSDGQVVNTTFGYYGDLIFNTLPSRSYLKVTTDQALYDCDVEVRLIRRDGQMDVMQLPFQGEFQVKLRLLQTQ